MRMILGIQRIRLCIAQLRIHVDCRLEMIHEGGAFTDILGCARSIGNEPRRGAVKLATLPYVIRRLRRDDDLSALGDKGFCSLLHVVVEGVNSRAVLTGLTHFGAGAGAVRAAVIGGGIGRATVVVAELNDDDVASDNEFLNLGKTSLISIRAGGAARNGFVDDGYGEIFAAPSTLSPRPGLSGRHVWARPVRFATRALTALLCPTMSSVY